MTEEKRRIIEWFIRHENIPGPLREKFFAWLLSEGNDPEIAAILEQQTPQEEGGDRDIQGMMRLHRAVSGGRRRGWRRGIAAAAVVVVIVTAGILLPSRMQEAPQTVFSSAAGVSDHTLPDGTRVSLSEGSTLSYSGDLSGSVREVALEGVAYLDVAKDASRPFRIRFSDGSLAEVLGTSFTAVSEHGLKEIVLLTGSVKVSLPNLKEPVLLEPDRRLVQSEGRVRIERVSAETLCSWHQPSLVFDGARLDEVLQTLSHRYHAEVDLVAKNVSPDRKITMTLSEESLEDAISILGVLLPVRAQTRGHHITLYDN